MKYSDYHLYFCFIWMIFVIYSDYQLYFCFIWFILVVYYDYMLHFCFMWFILCLYVIFFGSYDLFLLFILIIFYNFVSYDFFVLLIVIIKNCFQDTQVSTKYLKGVRIGLNLNKLCDVSSNFALSHAIIQLYWIKLTKIKLDKTRITKTWKPKNFLNNITETFWIHSCNNGFYLI